MSEQKSISFKKHQQLMDGQWSEFSSNQKDQARRMVVRELRQDDAVTAKRLLAAFDRLLGEI